jgi:hypothetical protein
LEEKAVKKQQKNNKDLDIGYVYTKGILQNIQQKALNKSV